MSERKIILDWVDNILSVKDWTPEFWAKKAKVTPTTITRFRKNEDASILAGRTLIKLAEAAGSPLPAVGLGITTSSKTFGSTPFAEAVDLVGRISPDDLENWLFFGRSLAEKNESRPRPLPEKVSSGLATK